MSKRLPIKSGLDFLRHKDGSVMVRNREGTQRLADRMAKREQKECGGFPWQGFVRDCGDYYRISIGGKGSP